MSTVRGLFELGYKKGAFEWVLEPAQITSRFSTKALADGLVESAPDLRIGVQVCLVAVDGQADHLLSRLDPVLYEPSPPLRRMLER